jgi:CheY-like chemotaxis protein
VALSKNPDWILMDINLPGKSGIKAKKILQNNPNTIQIPVIAISANAMSEGFKQYITKLIDTVSFIGAIQKYLQSIK